jgi:ectoine hydroxylase-related dioxygenase (phytanoyl-CoA dioxygenase family)
LWARAIVTTPALTAPVRFLIGDDAAVENTFLVIKWPGRAFPVPPHQDGINDEIELNPNRSVSCWVAITDAGLESGCLEIAPGTHESGYQRYIIEPGESERGRALTVANADPGAFVPVPLAAGHAVLFDTRLVHRSSHNTTRQPRIGLNIRYTTSRGFLRGQAADRAGWMPLDLP